MRGPDKEDDGADEREDAMQGYWFITVDEKRPSLVVDDAVLVGTLAWWTMAAMDGVADGGWCGDGVF